MKILFKISLPLIVLLLSTTARAQSNRLVKNLTDQLNRSYRFYDADVRKQERLSRTFDSLFNQLTESERSNSGVTIIENTVENKLIAMARYKAAHPEKYSDIESVYIFGVDNPKFRAPSSPPLRAAHVTADYRLVWEYFLLKPESYKMSARFDQRAGEALAIIQNPASLLTLESIYQNTLRDSVQVSSNAVLQKRRLVLTTLARTPSDQNLKSALKVVAADQLTIRKDPQWKPEVYLKSVLDGKENPKLRTQWRTIITRTNATSVDSNSRKVLQTLKQN